MANGYAVQDRLAKANRGEQLTYKWLCEALPDEYDVWHEPRIGGKKPDVVVFGPDLGLLVLEVKDWSADAVVAVDPARKVHLRSGPDVKVVTHPVEQAEGHLFAIKEMLERGPACVHAQGDHRGKLQFPFAKGAVLPNMRAREVEQLDLCTGYDDGCVLAADDIGSGQGWALRGRDLVSRLRRAFGVSFAWTQSDEMRGAVCAVLYPDTTIRRSYAGRHSTGAGSSAQMQLPLESTRQMSVDQRQVALELSGGHQVLQGVAGSGKSEVVAVRARILTDANPTWRILVLCFNGRETFLVALDNAQRIYESDDVPLSSAGVRSRGNAKILKINHRCSREINTFSRRFMWGDAAEGASIRVGDQTVIVPVSCDRSGGPVEVRRCVDVAE